jgi:ribonuclease HII
MPSKKSSPPEPVRRIATATIRTKAAKPAQKPLLFPDPVGLLAGVDEAGRGPLAGPVVAAAVILDEKKRILGLNDSKVLTPLQRDKLYDKIREKALCCSVGMASVAEIDELNIFHATMLAMQRAVEGLRLRPVKVLVDGNRLPKLDVLSEAIVDGDAKVKCISAASIIAKVTRDRMLVELHAQFPQYGFAAHKGYSTQEHLEALRVHGPCVHHRRHFAPVAAQFATEEGVEVSVQVQ